jgi:tripartite-type tricarboxylate transporter receptor subunit TctC
MRPTPFLALAFMAAFVSNSAIAQTPSRADAWPQRNVRIITPFPAGTGGDLSVRLFADRLAQRWGKPVIIENRPGAEGIVALTAFGGARDDHTLLYTNGGPLTVNPVVQDKLSYDPRDIVPITLGTNVFVAVTVPTSLKIDSLAQFVDFARSQPGKLNWGATAGALEFVVPSFMKTAGLDMVHMPYREFTPALQDLSEGRLQAYFSALASVLPQVQAGKVKALAVTNRERAPIAPDVPTAVEAGYADLTFDAFLGFFGSRDMPIELRQRIAADIRTVGLDPAITERLASTGQVVRTSTPAELASRVEEERAKVATIARALGRNPTR